MTQEMITIPKSEYDQLCKDSEWLGYLEAAGVDNWQGIEEAIQMRRDDQNGDAD
jgi:hypothetical protein